MLKETTQKAINELEEILKQLLGSSPDLRMTVENIVRNMIEFQHETLRDKVFYHVKWIPGGHIEDPEGPGLVLQARSAVVWCVFPALVRNTQKGEMPLVKAVVQYESDIAQKIQ